MSTLSFRTLILFIALALCLGAHHSQAVVLDWTTVTWTPGSLNNSYDIDATNPGTDITIGITGDTGQFITGFTPPNPQTPAITQSFQGGFGAVQTSLELRVDFTTTGQFVTITLSFANYPLGVSNVSFSLFDIDAAAYQDRISSITALSTDGTTLVAPIITGLGSAVSLSGTGLNQVLDGTASVADVGAGSGNGNATISFGATPITSITFTYGSGPSSPADPSTQKIGLSVIDFTAVVPEINPAVVSSLLCLLAIALLHAKKRQRL
jgi:hypothetical protein